MKISNFILLFIAASSLCSCKDVYYDFSKGDIDFIRFEEGDQFNILNSKTLDTISFQITKREDIYNYGGANLINDVYMQTINLYFVSDSGEYGHFFYYKESSYTLCDIIISANNSVVIFACSSAETNNIIDMLNVQETLYANVYYFVKTEKGINDTLFYTPDKGIIKFTDLKNGTDYVLIE